MKWPQQTDFTSAIQNPSVCFADSDLKNGEVAKGRNNYTLMFSGRFATVYKVSTGGKDHAVRCFTNTVDDQHERYGNLSNFLNHQARPDSFVDFEYVDKGITVGGEWYPIVKMEWVKGFRLDQYVKDNLDKPAELQALCLRWRASVGALRGLGIAHNDLQHGNVMVQDDRIRMVDYDGIFLPNSKGPTKELGHKNYQHPARKADNYDERIDNFPALVIYLSLLALRVDPSLWGNIDPTGSVKARFYNQDNLILTKEDFEEPSNSECFLALKNSQNPIVCRLTSYLAEYCDLPVDQVPDLEIIMRAVDADEPKAPRVGGVSNTSTGRPGGAASNIPSSPPSASPGGSPLKPPPISAGQAARPVTPTGQTSPAFAARRLRRTPGNAPAAATQQAPFRPSAQAPTLAPSSPTTGASSHSSPATPTVTATFPQQTNTQAQVPCQECGSSNDFLLIYCEIDGCDAVLHGTKQCRCGFYAPLNTNYCPGCGQSQV